MLPAGVMYAKAGKNKPPRMQTDRSYQLYDFSTSSIFTNAEQVSHMLRDAGSSLKTLTQKQVLNVAESGKRTIHQEKNSSTGFICRCCFHAVRYALRPSL